jgi:N-acetylneuraminic acid mutarotase
VFFSENRAFLEESYKTLFNISQLALVIVMIIKPVLTTLTIFILLLLFPFLSGVLFVQATDHAWVSKAPMQEARSGLGVAVVNGKIYAIGGAGKGGFSAANEEYNPETDTWILKAPMPTPRSAFGIAVYENKVYCIGGYTFTGSATAVNEVYNPVTDTWENKTSMPTARLNLRANVVNGKIYLIGGISYPDSGRSLNEVYEPASDTWTVKSPIPVRVDLYGSAVVGNKIYVMRSGVTQIYDADKDIWVAGVAPPLSSFIASAGVAGGTNSPNRVYLFGTNTEGPYWMLDIQGSTTQSYDPATGNWTVCTSMTTGRIDSGVVALNDKLYVIGGYSYGEKISMVQRSIVYSNVNEQYNPALDVSSFVDTAQASTQPSHSPILPSTSPSTIMAPESVKLPTIDPRDEETQIGAEPFLPVPVLAASVVVVVVVAVCLLGYFKKRKGSQEK